MITGNEENDYQGYQGEHPLPQSQQQKTTQEEVPFDFVEKGIHLSPKWIMRLLISAGFILLNLFNPGIITGTHLVIMFILFTLLWAILELIFMYLKGINNLHRRK